MKLGLISDTHGAVAPVRTLLAGAFAGADLVLHAGDVLYHGPRNPLPDTYNPAQLAEVINVSPAPFLIARGNCDSSVDEAVINVPLLAPYALVQWEGLRILVNHGDLCSRKELASEAKRLGARIALFGHIHTPVLEEEKGVLPSKSRQSFPAQVRGWGAACADLWANRGWSSRPAPAGHR